MRKREGAWCDSQGMTETSCFEAAIRDDVERHHDQPTITEVP